MRFVLWSAAIIGGIVLLMYLLFFDTFEVTKQGPMFAASIEPTLRIGDRVLTRRGEIPTYGQLARCRHPTDPNRWVIGRVFGRGGDTVTIQNESVATNGTGYPARHGCPPVLMVHPVTQETVELTCAVEENPAWTFMVLHRPGVAYEGDFTAKGEPGKMFIVSDNRHMHDDSRDFGQVDESTCEHIVFRLWGESYIDSSRRNTILW